jgi:tetratricopeptide (TPR) repeat protein
MKPFLNLLVICLLLFNNVIHGQQVVIDSLENGIKSLETTDTNYIISTHKLSYRYSEINISKSWFYAKETEKNAKEIGYKKGECLANINYAILFTNEGDLKSAVEHYKKAIEIAAQINYARGESISLNNIAEIYLRLKEYDIAIKYTNQAYELNKRIKEKRGQALNLEQLGNLYFKLNKPDIAYQQWSKGLAMMDSIDDNNLLALLLIDISKYNVYQNDITKGIVNLQKAQKICIA